MRRLPLVAAAISLAVLIIVGIYAVALPPPLLDELSVEVVSVVGVLVEKQATVQASLVTGILLMLALGGMTILFFANILKPKVSRHRPSRRRIRRASSPVPEELP
ncbi:MAG: hypothetical protein ACI9MC_003044 [Kiritimatiellia bacterium]|jgi:hypothetical protein